jgi:hypothetical protein
LKYKKTLHTVTVNPKKLFNMLFGYWEKIWGTNPTAKSSGTRDQAVQVSEEPSPTSSSSEAVQILEEHSSTLCSSDGSDKSGGSNKSDASRKSAGSSKSGGSNKSDAGREDWETIRAINNYSFKKLLLQTIDPKNELDIEEDCRFHIRSEGSFHLCAIISAPSSLLKIVGRLLSKSPPLDQLPCGSQEMHSTFVARLRP